MEQYFMPKEEDFENLRRCLDNYETDFLYIRLVGSTGGNVKINETLEDRELGFKKDSSGLHMLIDSSEVFHFPLETYYKGFSLAYERIRPTEDGIGRMVVLPTGKDPYDSSLPEPRRSFLRTDLDNHLMEIFFKGRVYLDFHSWFEKPYRKYWKIVTPKEGREIKEKRESGEKREYEKE